MFQVVTQITLNPDKMTARAQRYFNRGLKVAWREALLFWHRNFARGHFKRQAYEWYPTDYGRPKKGNRSPLVVTGTLRSRIMAAGTEANISGTSSGARLRMNYSRPAQYTLTHVKLLRGQIGKAHPDWSPGQVDHALYDQLRDESEKTLEAQAYVLAREKGIPLRKAELAVYRREGYSAETKGKFQRRIPAVNAAEVDRFNKFIKKFVLDYMEQSKAKTTRKAG